MAAERVLLEARHIGRRHPGGDGWLLNDVSLSLAAGKRVALAGPSGAGKTLLLRALAMLDPLDQGSVTAGGHAARHDGVPRFRKQVIYLHQRAALLEETVLEALRRPFRLAVRRQEEFDPSRAERWLARLGRNGDFTAKKVSELSGGEIQITALVRALQLDPNVLLLDEPTSALDPGTAQAVETLVAQWAEELPDARAYIWVSHDVQQAKRVGRRRIEMDQGRIVASVEVAS